MLRSWLVVLLVPLVVGAAACSRHVFEPLPATPEALLAFKLRTLPPGEVVRVERAGEQWTEGRVVASGDDSVVVAADTGGPVVIRASEVTRIYRQRPPAGPTIARVTGGGALVGVLLGGVLLISSRISDSPDDDYSVFPVLAWLASRGAAAGLVFGGVVHAASPEWIQTYPVPPGSRP